MEATITAAPAFLKELRESLAHIPNEKYIPTRSHPDMTPTEHVLQIDRLTKEFGDYGPTVFDVSRQHEETGETLTFCGLSNLGVSEDRAIAMAHLLSNVHILVNLAERYETALDVAVRALVKVSECTVTHEAEQEAKRAINEIAAIKEHAVTR